MDEIDDWLKTYNASIIKKPRVGIWIETSQEEKQRIRQKIGHLDIKENILTHQQRVRYIIYQLLKHDLPLTLGKLAEELIVSKTTIINDLTEVEAWVNKKGLRLIKKPNYGIKLEGDEIQWRKTVTEFLNETVDRENLIEILNQVNIETPNLNSQFRGDFYYSQHFNMFFEGLDILKLEEAVDLAENLMGVKFVDAAYIGLLVHLALALKRLVKNKGIEMSRTQLDKLKENFEFKTAKLIAEKIEKDFKVNIPEAEIGYITLHLLGAKRREDFSIEKRDEEDNKVNAIVKEIVRKAELFLGVSFEDDQTLIEGLSIHIKPALSRIKHGMRINNPLLEDIKTKYPQVFEAARFGCTALKKEIKIEILPEEVGYVAMHLGAALERKKSYQKNNFKALVVCSSGIGTAKMLSSRLKKEIPNLKITDEISVNQLKDINIIDGNDIVISTVGLNCQLPIPTITVSPLLSNDDLGKIEKALKINKRLCETRKTNEIIDGILKIVGKYSKVKNPLKLKKELCQYLEFNTYKLDGEEYLPMLTDLITEKTIKLKSKAKTWQEAVREAGQLLVKEDFVEHRYIDAMIKTVEEMGAYIVIAPGVAMPHARPEKGVKQVCMSLVTLETPVEFGHLENDPVDIIIALGAVDDFTHIRAMSDLMKFLSDEKRMNEIRRMNDVKETLKLFDYEEED